jgi:hypothetical protein
MLLVQSGFSLVCDTRSDHALIMIVYYDTHDLPVVYSRGNSTALLVQSIVSLEALGE